jgi:hypothetical protein
MKIAYKGATFLDQELIVPLVGNYPVRLFIPVGSIAKVDAVVEARPRHLLTSFDRLEVPSGQEPCCRRTTVVQPLPSLYVALWWDFSVATSNGQLRWFLRPGAFVGAVDAPADGDYAVLVAILSGETSNEVRHRNGWAGPRRSAETLNETHVETIGIMGTDSALLQVNASQQR